MVDVVNKPELSDQKYQTNGNIKDENYNGKFLFTMKKILSFGTNYQSILFMSTRFLKYKNNGVHVTQSQLAYIRDTTLPSYDY